MNGIKRVYLLPDWDGSVYQKWSYNFISRNSWRVVNQIGDFDDAMSQAALIYVVCKQRYGRTVNSAKHFMYLYQLYLRMEFNTYASKDGQKRKTIERLKERQIDKTSVCEGDLNIKLSKASGELRQVLEILFNSPVEIMEALRKDAHSQKKFWTSVLGFCKIDKAKSDTLSEELEKLLG